PFRQKENAMTAVPFRCAALLLLLSAIAAPAQAPDGPDQKTDAKKAAEQVARIEQLLDEPVETKALQEPMELADLLAAVEKQLPKDKKVSFRFDDKAFGKELAAVKKTQVKLPPFPRRMSVRALLRLALSKVVPEADDEIDYLVLPTHVLI